MAGKNVFMLLSNPFRPDPRVFKEAKTLVSGGHKVTILAWDRVGDKNPMDRMEGVSIVRFGPRAGFDSFVSMILNLPVFYASAFSYIVKRKPDVIHAHDFDTLPLGIIASWLRGAKLVYDSHESYPDMISDSAPYCVVKLVELDERLAIKKADAVIGTTTAIKKKFKRWGAKDLVTIMNCAEQKPPPSPAEIQEVKEHLAVGDRTVLGYVGTIEGIRGIDDIIDAIDGHPHDDLIFVLGGFGPKEKEIRAQARHSRNVKFIGPVPPHHVSLLNHSFDIMILLSDPRNGQTQYCIANKVFEAMAAGKPIIVTKNTLHQHLVEKYGTGIAIDYGDKTQLMEAIQLLKTDKDLYGRMSRAGKAAASSKYHWGEMEKRLMALYDRL